MSLDPFDDCPLSVTCCPDDGASDLAPRFIETEPGVRLCIPITYTEEELCNIRTAQAGVTMYLVHQNHHPKMLQRVTDTDWIFEDVDFTYHAVSDVTFSNAFISFKIINGDQPFQVGDYFTITTVDGAIDTITGPQNGNFGVSDTSNVPFTVPAGITSLSVFTVGAGGGGGGSDGSGDNRAGGAGGAGGFQTTTVAVTPGELFYVTVGEGGSAARFYFNDTTVGGCQGNSSRNGGNGGASFIARPNGPHLVSSGGGFGGNGAQGDSPAPTDANHTNGGSGNSGAPGSVANPAAPSSTRNDYPATPGGTNGTGYGDGGDGTGTTPFACATPGTNGVVIITWGLDALTKALPARVASTADIDLTTGGLLTIDDIVLVAGDRVLVKDQTLPAQNGIYDVAVGAWTRSADANTGAELVVGTNLGVTEGTLSAGLNYKQRTTGTITLGTTALSFTLFTLGSKTFTTSTSNALKLPVLVKTVGSNIALSGLQSIEGRLLVDNDRVLVKDQTDASDNGIYNAHSGAWTRATDADTAAEVSVAYVNVESDDSFWQQTLTITTLGTDLQSWEETEPPGNGQIAGVASMPGSDTTETWTITVTEATPERQEWTVIGSVSGEPTAYWKPGNYPRTVCFFEQRLFFGGSPLHPQHIWGSVAGDYHNLTVGNTDADGVIVQIAGSDFSPITHLVGARQLLPFTTSTEFSIAGPNNSAISGVGANVIKDHTRHGSNRVKPIRIGKEIIFLQRDSRKVRALSYSVTEDMNIAPDITIFSEHLTRNSVLTDAAFAADPDYIAWVIRSDGTLLSLTLAREFEATAWARHTTDGCFEGVSTNPGVTADDVFLVVCRTIDGVTKRYIETFDYENENTAWMDCASFYSGAETSTISGLDYLEGKTVTILADHEVHRNLVVTNGSIVLDYPVTEALVGLPFTTTVSLLNPEMGDASSSSQGKKVSVTDIIVRFQDTVNCLINGVPIPFRTNLLNLDAPIEVFTGDKSVKSIGWRSPKDITLTSESPTPFTVLGVIIRAAVN